MPSQTPGYRLPWPLGTDRVMDGDDQIRKLAQSVENCFQSALITIPTTTPNTPASITWTYPVAYAVAPLVLVALAGGTGTVTRTPIVAAAQATTTTGVSISGVAASGTAPLVVFALAIGPINPVT
jgi:hypothetical protein